MSKESIIKKKLENQSKQSSTAQAQNPPRRRITATQVEIARGRRRRLNRRFLIMLAAWVIALGVSIYFLTR